MTLGQKLHVPMSPTLRLWFSACKIAYLAPELLVSKGPSPHLWFLHAKQRLLDKNNKCLWVPDMICHFCMQTSDFWYSIQVSMGTRPHLSFCTCKTAWLAPESLDSMGCSPNLRFCAFKPATFEQKLHVTMSPRRHLWFSACKPAYLASELSVSRGPSPHLWFLHAKQRLLDKNNKCLWVPDMICHFCMQTSDFWYSIQVSMGTRPHLSFCTCKTAWLAPESLDSMGCSPNLRFCAFKTATLGPKLHVSMGPTPHLWFSACKTAYLAPKLLVSNGPSPHLWFLHEKQRLLEQNNKSSLVQDMICRFVHAKHRD